MSEIPWYLQYNKEIITAIAAGIVGYAIRWIEEKRRQTHEKETEYQKELKQHLPDIIQPLFKLLDNLWTSLIGLTDWDENSQKMVVAKGHNLKISVEEVTQVLTNLKNFAEKNETQLDLLLPHPLRSWQYTRLRHEIANIVEKTIKGENTTDSVSSAISTIIDIQNDLRAIVGFGTGIHLRSEYAFGGRPSHLQNLSDY